MGEPDISEQDCEEMKALYYDERYSLEQVADYFSCDTDTVILHLRYRCEHEEPDTEFSYLREKVSQIEQETEFDEYKVETTSRNTHSEFRPLILKLYRGECLITDVEEPRLLDVAHLLSWSKYPEHRHDMRNVIVLNKIHHAAFDSGIFTLSRGYEVCLSPEFETESEFLRRTLTEKEGERVELPEGAEVNPDFLEKHNEELDWWG